MKCCQAGNAQEQRGIVGGHHPQQERPAGFLVALRHDLGLQGGDAPGLVHGPELQQAGLHHLDVLAAHRAVQQQVGAGEQQQRAAQEDAAEHRGQAEVKGL
jgi:hypothetical protein